MLRRVLEAFEAYPGPMSLHVLSREVGIPRPALEGILEELVRMGRLARIEPNAAACSACGHSGGCPYVLSLTGVYYALPEMASACP
jgi:hypothetical protein